MLAQNYWPQSHLAAPSDDAIRREVELIKSLGFNGVRIHQKVEDERFLYWCDRLGVLVWAEMANAYEFSEEAVRRMTREWMDVVKQQASHPSIITWVPFNESWGVPDLPGDPAQRDYVRGLYHLTKALDPSRPVIGNDGWEHLSSDILSIHDYALDGESLRERYGTPDAVERALQGRPQHQRAMLEAGPRGGRPIILSEFGGISYAPQAGTPWFGYGSVSSDEELLAKYEELVTAVLDSPTIAGFCYTQLTDTEQETNGLLRADRRPKLDPAIVSAVTSRPSKAIPGDFIEAAQRSRACGCGDARRGDGRCRSHPCRASRARARNVLGMVEAPPLELDEGFVVATGFECSAPVVAGARMDELVKTGHWQRYAEDFQLAHSLGIRYARLAVPFHVVAVTDNPSDFDWRWTDNALSAARDARYRANARPISFGHARRHPSRRRSPAGQTVRGLRARRSGTLPVGALLHAGQRTARARRVLGGDGVMERAEAGRTVFRRCARRRRKLCGARYGGDPRDPAGRDLHPE